MSKVIIIAEAGVNHNGDIQVAKKKLSDAAVNAGS
jgi:N-acetylneuraminate synthase/N,N'-diacetyllegionaminate synthase